MPIDLKTAFQEGGFSFRNIIEYFIGTKRKSKGENSDEEETKEPEEVKKNIVVEEVKTQDNLDTDPLFGDP